MLTADMVGRSSSRVHIDRLTLTRESVATPAEIIPYRVPEPEPIPAGSMVYDVDLSDSVNGIYKGKTLVLNVLEAYERSPYAQTRAYMYISQLFMTPGDIMPKTENNRVIRPVVANSGPIRLLEATLYGTTVKVNGNDCLFIIRIRLYHIIAQNELQHSVHFFSLSYHGERKKQIRLLLEGYWFIIGKTRSVRR